MLQRKIPKFHVGTLFRRLLVNKYCELLYLSEVTPRCTVTVTYKKIKVLFQMVRRESRISMHPITCMSTCMKSTTNYTIEI